MNIAPGEPVPPGFENEVKQVTKIQSEIDRHTEALCGLEYVVELVPPQSLGGYNRLSYYCVLCNKSGDPNSIFAHLLSQNHRIKWLDKHFPTVLREMGPFRYGERCKEIMPRIVTYVCEQLEDSLGRMTPCVYEANEFSRSRERVIRAICDGRHLDESTGSTFLHLLDRGAILNAITGEL